MTVIWLFSHTYLAEFYFSCSSIWHELSWRWQTYQVIFVPVCTQGNLPFWQFWSLAGLSYKFWLVICSPFSFWFICINMREVMGRVIVVCICIMWQACALYDNWWPMLSGELQHHWFEYTTIYLFLKSGIDMNSNLFVVLAALMYVLLPMPLLFFAGSDGYSLLSESDSR